MTVPAFDLRVVRGADRMRIVPRGELDIVTAPQLEQAISEATSAVVSELVLDLRELTFMDSTGLRTLAQANPAHPTGRDDAVDLARTAPDRARPADLGLGPLLPLAHAPPDRRPRGSPPPPFSVSTAAAFCLKTLNTGRGLPSGSTRPASSRQRHAADRAVLDAEVVVGVHALHAEGLVAAGVREHVAASATPGVTRSRETICRSSPARRSP